MTVIIINVFLVAHIFGLSFSPVPLRFFFPFSSFLCPYFASSFIDKSWSFIPLYVIYSPLIRCKFNSR